MIAIDTNILVRFLVEDDETQSRAAAALVARAGAREEQLFISDIVLCETVWVLSASYKVPKPEIVDILGRLLRARQLTFRASDILLTALEAFAGGKGDFADYVIREVAKEAGAATLMTFDRTLLKEPGFARP